MYAIAIDSPQRQGDQRAGQLVGPAGDHGRDRRPDRSRAEQRRADGGRRPGSPKSSTASTCSATRRRAGPTASSTAFASESAAATTACARGAATWPTRCAGRSRRDPAVRPAADGCPAGAASGRRRQRVHVGALHPPRGDGDSHDHRARGHDRRQRQGVRPRHRRLQSRRVDLAGARGRWPPFSKRAISIATFVARV